MVMENVGREVLHWVRLLRRQPRSFGNGVIFKGHLELQIARATKERKGPRKEGLLHQSLSSSTASQPIWVPPVSAASISHARDCAVIPRFVRGSVSSLPLK